MQGWSRFLSRAAAPCSSETADALPSLRSKSPTPPHEQPPHWRQIDPRQSSLNVSLNYGSAWRGAGGRVV
ncbi:unnamed protein product [Urochloa humidicola]